MATITPTLSITANAAGATVAGPMSSAISLSVTGALTVDTVQAKTVTPANSGAPTLLLAGDTYGGDSGDTAGTDGSFLYLKNSTASGTSIIYVGTVLQGAAAPADMGAGTTALDNADDATLRLMTLKVGEFAFLPWDYMQDIYVGASSGSQSLEYMLFNRA